MTDNEICGENKKTQDLIGKRFGKLIALKRIKKKGRPYWECQCDCGGKSISREDGLKSGNTKSCGCIAREHSRQQGKKNKKYNEYDLSNSYGIGYTLKKICFYFDLEDYDKIKNYCWHIDSIGYVATNSGDRKLLRMHNFLMKSNTKTEDIDHINHILTDNRKVNLRVCLHCKNIQNSKIRTNNKSGVTGVSWNKKSECWHVEIQYNKIRINLGEFNDFDIAVRVRKEAEEKYFKEYSYNNSLMIGEQNEKI